MSCTRAPSLGAYALGVDEPERRAIERHLASCGECRAELSDLAEVAAMLATARDAGAVDVHARPESEPETATGIKSEEEPEPSQVPARQAGPTAHADDLLDRILSAVATERSHEGTTVTTIRGWRRRAALGIAAAVVVGASVVGVMVTGDDPQSSDQTQILAGRSAYGVTARTTVSDESWGTRIDMALESLPPLTSCRLVARAHDGRTETVASWQVTYNDGLEVEGMTRIRPDELAKLQVIDTTGRRLVTVPATPTERKSK